MKIAITISEAQRLSDIVVTVPAGTGNVNVG